MLRPKVSVATLFSFFIVISNGIFAVIKMSSSKYFLLPKNLELDFVRFRAIARSKCTPQVRLFSCFRGVGHIHSTNFFCLLENSEIVLWKKKQFLKLYNTQGAESIEIIMEKLKSRGCGVAENYETFSRVSIRRLGRLLPDARRVCFKFDQSKISRKLQGNTVEKI